MVFENLEILSIYKSNFVILGTIVCIFEFRVKKIELRISLTRAVSVSSP